MVEQATVEAPEIEIECTDRHCAQIWFVPADEWEPNDEYQHTCPSCLCWTGEVVAE